MRFFFRSFSGVLLLYLFTTHVQAQLPPSEIPMYGTTGKKKLTKRDEAFIASIEKAGKTRQAVARDAIGDAWVAYGQGDLKGAIRRFNQGWLLDPENGDAYHGFALISTVRDRNAEAAEKYFRIAIAKPGVSASAFVSYGRFLWIVDRLDESLVQLEKALAVSPTARDARLHIARVYYKKKDFAKACEWARAAKANNDDLPTDFLEDMCKKGATAAGPPPPAPVNLASERRATATIRGGRKRA
ncbi:MAG: tetratricopeptide repeat protein [Betaproteobacteria bacterium]